MSSLRLRVVLLSALATALAVPTVWTDAITMRAAMEGIVLEQAKFLEEQYVLGHDERRESGDTSRAEVEEGHKDREAGRGCAEGKGSREGGGSSSS